jgi:hypothetical protein
MRKGLGICSILLLVGLSLAAQGHGRSTGSVPGSAHSNAPGGPAAGTDRDTGKARAADVGKKEGMEADNKGKKKGQRKHHKEELKKG